MKRERRHRADKETNMEQQPLDNHFGLQAYATIDQSFRLLQQIHFHIAAIVNLF